MDQLGRIRRAYERSFKLADPNRLAVKRLKVEAKIAANKEAKILEKQFVKKTWEGTTWKELVDNFIHNKFKRKSFTGTEGTFGVGKDSSFEKFELSDIGEKAEHMSEEKGAFGIGNYHENMSNEDVGNVDDL